MLRLFAREAVRDVRLLSFLLELPCRDRRVVADSRICLSDWATLGFPQERQLCIDSAVRRSDCAQLCSQRS